jgi:hypothetical protein
MANDAPRLCGMGGERFSHGCSLAIVDELGPPITKEQSVSSLDCESNENGIEILAGTTSPPFMAGMNTHLRTALTITSWGVPAVSLTDTSRTVQSALTVTIDDFRTFLLHPDSLNWRVHILGLN